MSMQNEYGEVSNSFCSRYKLVISECVSFVWAVGPTFDLIVRKKDFRSAQGLMVTPLLWFANVLGIKLVKLQTVLRPTLLD